MSDHSGGCHCGNVRYIYGTPKASADWPVRRCTCSHCVRFGARYTSGPETRLDVTVLYASMVERYEFGTRTAQFLRCGRCGVMFLASCEIDAAMHAVLNVNTLDEVGELNLAVSAADFDNEELAERLTRRKANWIPEVSIHFVNA